MAEGSQKSILPIKKWQTSAGTPVFYVYEPELPMVDIQVVFDAGSARDSTKPGLAKITNEALSSGTKHKNADQIAMALEDVGARFSTAVSRDMAVVALRSLVDEKSLQPALAAFGEILTEASFPMNEFKRIQKQTLAGLEEQEQSPASIANRAFYTAVFDNNPYGHPISGTKASISSLNADELRHFYEQFYTAQNSLIAIVGSIDESRAKALAEGISASLMKGEKATTLTYQTRQEASSYQHIQFPSSQTHVLMGQTGINRNDPDYFPIMVGNYVLGGGLLTSRLFDEVREKRGLAYSVRSQFNAFKDRGPFMIELQTRNSEANNAIKVVNATLVDFVSKGPSAAELELAKRNLTQGFILRLASNSAIMAQLITIGFYNLPLNYLDTYQANITKVSDQDVKKVFQSKVNPNKLITITVGNNVSAEPKKAS